MGMRIGSSNSTSATQNASVANWQQRQQGFKDLFSSLKAGDLGAAQKAYSAVTGGASAQGGNSLLGQIGQALQNGDLAGAQQAAQTLQANRSGHHHHRPQGSDGATAAASTTNSSATGPGSLINLTA